MPQWQLHAAMAQSPDLFLWGPLGCSNSLNKLLKSSESAERAHTPTSKSLQGARGPPKAQGKVCSLWKTHVCNFICPKAPTYPRQLMTFPFPRCWALGLTKHSNLDRAPFLLNGPCLTRTRVSQRHPRWCGDRGHLRPGAGRRGGRSGLQGEQPALKPQGQLRPRDSGSHPPHDARAGAQRPLGDACPTPEVSPGAPDATGCQGDGSFQEPLVLAISDSRESSRRRALAAGVVPSGLQDVLLSEQESECSGGARASPSPPLPASVSVAAPASLLVPHPTSSRRSPESPGRAPPPSGATLCQSGPRRVLWRGQLGRSVGASPAWLLHLLRIQVTEVLGAIMGLRGREELQKGSLGMCVERERGRRVCIAISVPF